MGRLRLFGFNLFLMLLLAPMVIYRIVDSTLCSFGSPSFDDHYQTTQQELKQTRLFSKSLPSRIQGPKQKISYIIHQTNEGDMLTADMIMAIESVQQQNPQYAHRYYNGTDRRQFIRKHMGPTVLACYDKILPNAYKADLFRYSVVLTHGGCYADIGFVFIQPLREVITNNDTFISTPDGLNMYADMNSAFFCAEPNHPILALTLKKAVQHISTSNYTDGFFGITGPAAFINGFMEYFNHSVRVWPTSAAQFANGVRLLRQEICGCTAYPVKDSNGTIILFHKYPRFNVDARVLYSGSHYSIEYKKRTVFNESVIVPADGKYLVGT